MLYKAVLTFESVDLLSLRILSLWIKSLSVTMQLKATHDYFYVVLLIVHITLDLWIKSKMALSGSSMLLFMLYDVIITLMCFCE